MQNFNLGGFSGLSLRLTGITHRYTQKQVEEAVALHITSTFVICAEMKKLNVKQISSFFFTDMMHLS